MLGYGSLHSGQYPELSSQKGATILATSSTMNGLPLFGLSVLMSFVAFGIVTKIYIWPRLRMAQRSEALIALAVPHTFRFIGLSFLIPGVVSPSLPSDFSFPAAYGDLFAVGKAVFAEQSKGCFEHAFTS